MEGAILTLAVLLVAAASLFVAYQGWRVTIRNPRLFGSPLAGLRRTAKSPQGIAMLVLMVIALATGVIGGLWLSKRVEEGNQRHLKDR